MPIRAINPNAPFKFLPESELEGVERGEFTEEEATWFVLRPLSYELQMSLDNEGTEAVMEGKGKKAKMRHKIRSGDTEFAILSFGIVEVHNFSFVDENGREVPVEWPASQGRVPEGSEVAKRQKKVLACFPRSLRIELMNAINEGRISDSDLGG